MPRLSVSMRKNLSFLLAIGEPALRLSLVVSVSARPPRSPVPARPASTLGRRPGVEALEATPSRTIEGLNTLVNTSIDKAFPFSLRSPPCDAGRAPTGARRARLGPTRPEGSHDGRW